MTLVHHEGQVQQDDGPVLLLFLNVSRVSIAFGVPEEAVFRDGLIECGSSLSPSR